MRAEPDRPSVDVIIAARDEAARLEQCLAALRAQDYPPALLRIIVVDDHSRDHTAKLAAGAGAEVLSPRGRGAGAARNHALLHSDGELVAFLDGHCVVDRAWVRRLAASFADERVGGCQARIDNRAGDRHLQRYLRRSGSQLNAHVLEATVWGEHNLFPWILTGNAMFRRRAASEAGGFDESLPACEDVDLSWRIVLLGYQLCYEDSAMAVHYNDADWGEFLRKARRYGQGAAILAGRYRAHGARTTFKPASLLAGGPWWAQVALSYWLGFRIQALRSPPAEGSADVDRRRQAVLDRFRVPFAWHNARVLAISTEVVYWRRGNTASVAIHLPSRSRVVLEGVGNFIWRQLAYGCSRDQIVHAIIDQYGVAEVTVASDLDEFVEELLEIGLLVERSPQSASYAPSGSERPASSGLTLPPPLTQGSPPWPCGRA